jgi:ADP-ribose pyrophosphatase
MSRTVREETSAGGIVYRIDRGEPIFLLIRDSYKNWGFPKGHLEAGEQPDAAALREVEEETGLRDLVIRGPVDTIEWSFRFRGDPIHKVCHFFLMETAQSDTSPQRTEGITACRWSNYAAAARMLSYRNAREVLSRAHSIIAKTVAPR